MTELNVFGGILIPSKCKKPPAVFLTGQKIQIWLSETVLLLGGHVVWEVQSHESYEKLL